MCHAPLHGGFFIGMLVGYRARTMHQSLDTVVLRLRFKPDNAADFLFEEDVEAGKLVHERNDYTLEEAYDFIREFHTSLDDAIVLINGEKVVNLSDFSYDI